MLTLLLLPAFGSGFGAIHLQEPVRLFLPPPTWQHTASPRHGPHVLTAHRHGHRATAIPLPDDSWHRIRPWLGQLDCRGASRAEGRGGRYVSGQPALATMLSDITPCNCPRRPDPVPSPCRLRCPRPHSALLSSHTTSALATLLNPAQVAAVLQSVATILVYRRGKCLL